MVQNLASEEKNQQWLRDEEFRRLGKADAGAQWVCLVIAIIISTACFAGLREMLGEGKALLCAVLAFGGGFSLSVLWAMLFRSAPTSLDKAKQDRLVLYAAIMTLIGTSFSAQPAATMIGGNDAITQHMTEFVNQSTDNLASATGWIQKEQVIPSNFQSEASALENQAQSEASTGAIANGLSGAGPVTSGLAAMAVQMNDIANQQRDALASGENFVKSAQNDLRQMEEIAADTDIDNVERQKKFAESASDFNNAITSILNIDLLSSLDGFNPAGTAYSPPTPGGQEALRNVEQSVEQFVAQIRNNAGLTQDDNNDVELAPFSPISAGNAVKTYWQSVVGAWAIAVGLDLMPLLLLMILIILHRSVREQYQPPLKWGRPETTLYPDPPNDPSDKPDSNRGGGAVVEFADRKKASAAE